MTDNGSAYRSYLIADLCRSRRLRHIFTRPNTPRTNGKAERFIQTAMRQWAYARPHNHSQQRADALLPWLPFLQPSTPSSRHRRPHPDLPPSAEQPVPTPHLGPEIPISSGENPDCEQTVGRGMRDYRIRESAVQIRS